MLDRLKTFAGAVRAASARIAGCRRTPAVCCGLALGVAGWSAAHPFAATFGFDRETVAALLLAAAGSYALGTWFTGRRSSGLYGLPSLFAAGWLVLLPAVLSAAEWLVAAAPVSMLDRQAVRLVLLTVAGLVAFGPPSFCVGMIVSRWRGGGQGAALLLSVGLGIAADAFVLAPVFGLHVPLLCVAVCTAVVWFVGILRGGAGEPSARAMADAAGMWTGRRACGEPQDAPSPLTSLPRERGTDERGRYGRTGSPHSDDIRSGGAAGVRVACSAAVTAVLCGACGRALAQLAPEAGYLLAAGVAAFFVGVTAGAAARWRQAAGEDVARRSGAALAAAAALLPLAAFPWLVERHLDANAYVSTVFWLMAIRAGTVAAVFLPLGLGCGMMAVSAAGRVGTIACAFAVGLAASGWLIPVAGVVPLAVAAAAGLILVNVGPVRSAVPRTRRGWGLAAACTAGFAAAVLNVGRYEPARAARLLFSTEAFVARQHGVRIELLPYLNDSRLAGLSERAGGTVSLWKQGGDGLVIRLDGVPVAATAMRPDRCPLPTADVLRVALPLALHEAPESLLLLGDPAGVATATAAAFPLREIVCYDPADGVREAVDRLAGGAVDGRVIRREVPPRIAVAAEDRTFDVVVSEPGTPSLLSAASCFTREFYAEAAERMAADGIFCQRLRYADLGPEPLRVIAATTRDLFGDRMVMEVGSGEYVLLGTRPGSALVRPDMVERLRRPHVRRTLAALGWDWCVPLNLASVEQEGLNKLARGASANTASNGLLACTLPQEVMRWGLKSQELRQVTAGMTTRLIAHVPGAGQRDVLDRLAEVTGQHRLMTEYPDQPWAYRKEVRTQLKETPRSVIRPVAGEVRRVMHPDDRRRLDYFAALGEAAKEPREEALANLERFAEPYDPLLTYFLHHEAAPLYARLGPAGRAAELAHRLHAAYFADLGDRSVRNEISALELLVANPGLVPDEAERFDQLNGLVEVLLGRWEARGTAAPKSPAVVMVDIDKTLDATEAAVDAMGPLAGSAGLTADQWRLRKAAIERTLTRPLRSYRTSLLPHLRAAQREAEKTASK